MFISGTHVHVLTFLLEVILVDISLGYMVVVECTTVTTLSSLWTDKPHNPMVNAGAIVISSLLKVRGFLGDVIISYNLS